ncbi:energy transducer TonB [Fibrisoma montanum]|uniref:Energy transducer TonB n=1 Tax=Fibrisoma montanum TaxID=2305895 RepID=A0A418MDP7_9BACT|nr:energy transducer TonB [Fibrisoma montanum]
MYANPGKYLPILVVKHPLYSFGHNTILPDVPVEKPIPLPPVEAPPTVNTVRDLPPVVMPDAEVVEDVLPPTTDELADATPGDQTAEGTGDVEVIQAPEGNVLTVVEKTAKAVGGISQKLMISILLWILTQPSHGQTFINTVKEPAFPGGQKALTNYMRQQVRYPKAAEQAGVRGRVFASFVIDTLGFVDISTIKILKGLGYGCDEEAVRVIRHMPRWTPGTNSGKVWAVLYNLPIYFPVRQE